MIAGKVVRFSIGKHGALTWSKLVIALVSEWLKW